MIEINRNPSSRELRQFAGIWFPALCGVVGWGLIGIGQQSVAYGLFGAALLFAMLGLAVPGAIRWLYLALVYLTYPIGWVVSRVVVFILFFCIVTPTGLLLRLFSKDPLQKRLQPHTSTYWKERPPATEKSRYFRQF